MIRSFFLIIGLIVFAKEASVLISSNGLINSNVFSLPLRSELIFFYLQGLFYYLALPLFFICVVLEFFGILSRDEINRGSIHLFYRAIYFLLILYWVFFAVKELMVVFPR
jgi:hypothetical protein